MQIIHQDVLYMVSNIILWLLPIKEGSSLLGPLIVSSVVVLLSYDKDI